MQVSATLIAAQQAAREARARLNVPQAAEAGFAKALEQVAPKDSFAALPFQQKAGTAQAAAPQQPAAPGKLGQHINIVI